MKKQNILSAVLLFLAIGLSSCQKGTGIYHRVNSIDTVMATAYAKFYGAYYDGLPCNVLSLDLYSKGLTFDSLGSIRGEGTNLYLSDIFVPLSDTTFRSCTYTIDTTNAVFTSLPGMDFDGGTTGAYLLVVSGGDAVKVDKIYYFKSGEFTINQEDDTTNIEFHLVTEDKRTFDATYRGVIQEK